VKNFSITTLTKDKVPALPFLTLKEKVLGKKYVLSLVVVGDARAKSLNETYRRKSYIPNVLSFPIDENMGEIFINLKQAKREHRARGESFEYFVALLFVHSMLHLIGRAHGSTMESEEQKFLAQCKITNTLS
jgi:probable rRNA maturation factor